MSAKKAVRNISAQHDFPRTPFKTVSKVVLKPSLHPPDAWIMGWKGAGQGRK